MTLVAHRKFSEHYSALVARKQPEDELLKNVIRDERAQRRGIDDLQWDEFRDILHITGVWLTEKKEAEKGFLPKLDDRQLQIWKREREIWFPKEEPRLVPPPVRRLKYGYPFAKSRVLMDEETKLRSWLEGVEQQLRSHIQRANDDSLYILTCFDILVQNEERGRQRIESEEYEVFAAIRKSVFLKAPPGFFRQKVIERYGETKVDEEQDMTLEQVEELHRTKMLEEESAGLTAIYDYVDKIYASYFFMIHHQEICGRAAIIEEEREALFHLTVHNCRNSFGLLYYYTPLVALHTSPNCDALRQLCLATVEDMREKDKQGKALLRPAE